MFFAMAEDVRVILIKLADRVHNMETLEFIPAEKQKRLALETLEIFSPLANRLGIRTIQTKLENLAFPYLYPKEYQWFKEHLQETRQEERKYLEKARAALMKILEKEKIPFLEIQARLKSSFSLYQKLAVKGMNLDQVFDRMALRIIVQDVKTCYEILGAIHKYWRPLPGRIKDYIAFPKPNGYQSLHTTVFADQGKILEVQIRTEAMHEIAEHGICAHWAQKEGINLKRQGEKFAWIKQLASWQKEISSQKEYLEGLKIDFFKNRIFVLTPKGDIIDLPEGACAVDFAYAVHSEIGNHCVGAKANGKIISLSHPLKNGDVVEIFLSKKRGPSRDWLKFVKTGLARSHIKKQTEVNFFKGLQKLKDRIFPAKSSSGPRPRPEREVLPAKAKPVLKPTVLVGGKTEVAYSLAKCCRPKVNDQIAAYLTKTKGASVHLQTCQNLKRLRGKFPEKILEAQWRI
jgi:GTP pyrophosphokinase